MKTFKYMGVDLFTYVECILIQPIDGDDCDASFQYLSIEWKLEVTDFVKTFRSIEVFPDGTFTLWDDDGDSGPEHIPFSAVEGWRKASKLDYPPSYYENN